jgi:hypothetical protein
LLTFLRRLFVQAPAIRELRERLSDVESDLAWLALELKKLRGRVTGGIRHQDAPGSTNGGAPGPDVEGFVRHMDPVSARIWRQRLAAVPRKEG